MIHTRNTSIIGNKQKII